MAFRPIEVSLGAGMAGEAGDVGCGGCERWVGVAERFRGWFGDAPQGLARAPGRVNLIGEHIDYEGYAVLPMAIEQDVCVAFAVSKRADSGGGGGIRLLADLANANAAEYPPDRVEMSMGSSDATPELRTGRQAWVNYVICGFFAARALVTRAVAVSDSSTQSQTTLEVNLQLMVDGRIPPACGLSSSSALVVASAMATTYAMTRCGVPSFVMPRRVEMAEVCRRAEHHVGTMSGGMDQAISCLGQRGHAFYITFKPELHAQPVKLLGMNASASAGGDQGGYSFVVANSGVVAQKAVDATTRYNKRVVECALAAKVIGKGQGLDGWQQIERLADLQERLATARGGVVSFRELQALATDCCPLSEYSLQQLEGPECLGNSLAAFFEASDMRAGVERVLAAASAASTFQLQQRARHVWAEAERVEKFKALCSALGDATVRDDRTQASTFAELGRLMLDTHRSCQLLYECSCDELDALVATAMEHGALGARLTGAGWGGCVVVLAANRHVPIIMEKLRATIGLLPGERDDAVFKSEPAAGADILSFTTG